MRGLARIEQDVLGWVDIELDECGPYDAICKPLAMAPCTSDVHIVWGHAYMSDAPNRVVGHEATAEVVKHSDGQDQLPQSQS